ncbi:MAG: SPFH domain-containing protein [Acidimicrobiales bacterium]
MGVRDVGTEAALNGAVAFLPALRTLWVVVPVVVLVIVVVLVVVQPVFDRARREEIIVLTAAGHPMRLICGDASAWSELELERNEADPSGDGRERSWPVGRQRGPGFVRTRGDEVHVFDRRGTSFTTPRETVLSRDLVTLEVSAFVSAIIVDPILAVTTSSDWAQTLRKITVGAVRRIVAGHALSELTERRSELESALRAELSGPFAGKGFRLRTVEFADVVLPEELRRSLARAAEAEREALAVRIAAAGEAAAADEFAAAAIRLGADPLALDLRVLRLLQATAAEDGTTVVFPPPTPIAAPVAAPRRARRMRVQMP